VICATASSHGRFGCSAKIASICSRKSAGNLAVCACSAISREIFAIACSVSCASKIRRACCSTTVSSGMSLVTPVSVSLASMKSTSSRAGHRV